MSFTIGQRVCRKFTKHNQYEDDRDYGEVVAENAKDGTVFVKWESSWRQPQTEEKDPSQLMTEEEAEAVFNRLEEEYNVVANQVHAKMLIAAVLLNEANAIAATANLDLSEMEAASPLLGAMRNCGWRTSGLSC